MLTFEFSEITNQFQHNVFPSYDDAHEEAVNAYLWNDEDIQDGKEKIFLEINGEMDEVTLSCLYVDSGSEDYIYYID